MKYPRTYHVPFSPGATNDDKIADNFSNLVGKKIVITEKLDGSNSAITKSGPYARSHATHTKNPWDGILWEMWNRIKNDLDHDTYLFGENMYAVHSIEYPEIESYFYLFGVRDSETWLSWKEVEEYSYLLDIPTAPVFFEGQVDSQEELQSLVEKFVNGKSQYGDTIEGVVVRVYDSFENDDFSDCVMKWVRENHVTTDEHWSRNWKRAKLKGQY